MPDAVVEANWQYHPWRRCVANYTGTCETCGLQSAIKEKCGEQPLDFKLINERYEAVRVKLADKRARAAAEQERKDAIKVRIGSPEANIIAKFGQPERVNRTVNRWGVSKQFVYDGVYIYTNNGVVTSSQN